MILPSSATLDNHTLKRKPCAKQLGEMLSSREKSVGRTYKFVIRVELSCDVMPTLKASTFALAPLDLFGERGRFAIAAGREMNRSFGPRARREERYALRGSR